MIKYAIFHHQMFISFMQTTHPRILASLMPFHIINIDNSLRILQKSWCKHSLCVVCLKKAVLNF